MLSYEPVADLSCAAGQAHRAHTQQRRGVSLPCRVAIAMAWLTRACRTRDERWVALRTFRAGSLRHLSSRTSGSWQQPPSQTERKGDNNTTDTASEPRFGAPLDNFGRYTFGRNTFASQPTPRPPTK